MANSEAWDIAGFTDARSQLGKRMPSGELIVDAGVELSEERDSLIWPMYPTAKPRIVKPTPTMFARFIELREALPDEIRAFAKQWGRLYVRQDGAFILGDIPVEEASYREPIETWRYLSSRAHAVLSIAAALTENKRAAPTDWGILSSLNKRMQRGDWPRLHDGPFPFWILADRGFSAFANESVQTQRLMLTVEANLWMKLGGLGLVLGLGEAERGWRLELFFRGRLLAALALQIALTLSGSEAPRVCSGCKHLYLRTKKDPKVGEANYCDRCGRNESVRQADKRRREKTQEARRLYAEGIPIREIRARLNVRKISTVRDWVEKGK